MSTTELKKVIPVIFANVKIIEEYLDRLDDADDEVCEEVLEDITHATDRLSKRVLWFSQLVDEAKKR